MAPPGLSCQRSAGLGQSGHYLLKRPLGCVGPWSPVWSVSYLMLWLVPAAAFPPESRPLLHLALPSRQVWHPGSLAGLGSLTGPVTRSGFQPLLFHPCAPVFPPRLPRPQKYIFVAQTKIVIQAWVLEESLQGLASLKEIGLTLPLLSSGSQEVSIAATSTAPTSTASTITAWTQSATTRYGPASTHQPAWTPAGSRWGRASTSH